MQDHEIFTAIKSLNTDDFAKAKKAIEFALNVERFNYSTEQIEILQGFLKDETKFQNARAARKEAFLEELAGLVRSFPPQYKPTDAVINDFALQHGITKEEARKVHINAGRETSREKESEVITGDSLKKRSDIILDGAAVETIEKSMEKLHRLKADQLRHYPGLNEAKDVYEVLACVFKGTREDYIPREKRATIIKNLDEFSTANANLGSVTTEGILAALFPMVKTTIFVSDASKEKYDNYIIYHSPGMQKVVKSIQSMPRASRNEVEIANHYIAEISGFFEDEVVAVSLFNDAAELNPPYIPKPVEYSLTCHICGREMKFRSQEALGSTKKCVFCNSPLKLHLQIDYSVKPSGALSSFFNLKNDEFFLYIKVSAIAPSLNPFKIIPKMFLYANPSYGAIPSKDDYTHSYNVTPGPILESKRVHFFSEKIHWPGFNFKEHEFKLYIADEDDQFSAIVTQRGNLRE